RCAPSSVRSPPTARCGSTSWTSTGADGRRAPRHKAYDEARSPPVTTTGGPGLVASGGFRAGMLGPAAGEVDRTHEVVLPEAGREGDDMQLVVARIGRAHGLRGEVALDLRTDTPEERLATGTVLQTDPPATG